MNIQKQLYSHSMFCVYKILVHGIDDVITVMKTELKKNENFLQIDAENKNGMCGKQRKWIENCKEPDEEKKNNLLDSLIYIFSILFVYQMGNELTMEP